MRMVMSGHAAQKRSACDRCREQKLRCLRGEANLHEPCARCQRLELSCVTSGARPLGRPRTRIRNASLTAASPSAPSPGTLLLESTTLASALGTPSTILSTTPMLPLSSNISVEDNLLASSLDGINFPSLEGTSLDGIEALFGTLEPAPDGDLTINGWGSSGALSGAEPLFDPSVTPSFPETEAMVSLSRLNESVSRQLAKINSYPWEDPLLMQNTCAAKITSADDNPVAEALQTTTSFIAVLKSLSPAGGQSPGEFSGPDLGDLGASDAVSDPLSTTTYLLILSTYLQLMRLYNTMFRRLVEYLVKAPEEVMSGFRPQPDLRITGIPAISSQLYIKIITQAISHYIEAFEHLLGLPAGYCVSGRSASRMGIFSDFSTAGLLGTVMSQGNDAMGLGNIMTGKGLVLALRGSMAKVQELLRFQNVASDAS